MGQSYLGKVVRAGTLDHEDYEWTLIRSQV
jgi:hypothetical protein